VTQLWTMVTTVTHTRR